MPIVIDPNELHTVEVDDCRFQVRALTGRQMLALSNAFASEDNDGSGMYDVLHEAIQSWSNIVDASGTALPVSPENIDRLPVSVCVKVFEFVANLSGLNGEDSGN